jgi:hypothetical protein
METRIESGEGERTGFGDGEPALDGHQAYVSEGGGLGIDQDESGNGCETIYRDIRANAISNRGRGSESLKQV